MDGLRALSVGARLQRWIKDEIKRSGDRNIEISFYADNSFYIFCETELGMYRVGESWRKHRNLERFNLFYSDNLKKWVVSVELKNNQE